MAENLPPVQLKENLASNNVLSQIEQLETELGNTLPPATVAILSALISLKANNQDNPPYFANSNVSMFWVDPILSDGDTGNGKSINTPTNDFNAVIDYIVENNIASAENPVTIMGIGDRKCLTTEMAAEGVGTGDWDLPDFVSLYAPGWTLSSEGEATPRNVLNIADSSYVSLKAIELHVAEDVAIWKNSGSGFASVRLAEGVKTFGGAVGDSIGVNIESGSLDIHMHTNEAATSTNIEAAGEGYVKVNMQTGTGTGKLPKPPYSDTVAESVDSIIYVATTGDDSTGTRGDITKPFATPGAAKAAALPGDTIKVGAGTYDTNTTGLAANYVNWEFAIGAIIKASDTGVMWNDGANWSYKVTGYGQFGDGADATANSYLMFFSNPTSRITFECESIGHKSNSAIIYLGNGSLKLKAHGNITNHNDNNLGGVIWATGSGTHYIEAANYNTLVGGLASLSTPNGTILYNAGFTGKGYWKGDMNKTVDGQIGPVYSRTGSTGMWYMKSDITWTGVTVNAFTKAGFFHQGGWFEFEGDVTVDKSSGFYSNNKGTVNWFHHKSGTIESLDGDAIRLHDTLDKQYQFDGSYISDVNTKCFETSGNITGSRIDIGKDSRANFRAKAGAAIGIEINTAATYIFGDAVVICDDGASGVSLQGTASVDVQINGKLTSNVDKNANVTPYIASTFDFNTNWQF